MKKAVTLIELVFVLVIIGIVSAVIIPRFNRSTLHEAAAQIISHIRYTQHLALLDDKFDEKDSSWYKSRWQLLFTKNAGSNDQWAYTIFSDFKGRHTGNPDKEEIAKNPLDVSKYLTGGTSGTGLIHTDDDEATREMNIGMKYGITNVQFSGCGSTAKRIAFDHTGRPIIGDSSTMNKLYSKDDTVRLLRQQCQIILTDDRGNTLSIAIEPETGYAHTL